jgi:Carboxypeptidase regulatory-like domain
MPSMLPRLTFFAFVLCPAFVPYVACSAGDVSPPPAIDGGGGADGQVTTDGGGGGESSSGGTTQKGKIVDLAAGNGIAGATVTLGATTVQTDSSGKYEGAVDPTKPFNMKVEKTGYYTLTEQETQVKASIDLGKTSFLSEQTASVLLGTLQNYDSTLGVLTIGIINQTCADEAGATFELTMDGAPLTSASLYYFDDSGAPTPAQKSAVKGQYPHHAVAFNVPVNKPVTVTGKHPTCATAPFPVDQAVDTGTITYVSAAIATLPGKATSFARIFLK